jgi:hypothetical protein
MTMNFSILFGKAMKYSSRDTFREKRTIKLGYILI